jgi:hypothetical protein
VYRPQRPSSCIIFPDERYFPRVSECERGPRPGLNGQLRFLYSGTVTEHYRLDIVVKAVAIAITKNPQAQIRNRFRRQCHPAQ